MDALRSFVIEYGRSKARDRTAAAVPADDSESDAEAAGKRPRSEDSDA